MQINEFDGRSRTERIKALSESTGISLEAVAIAVLLKSPQMTAEQVAERIGVDVDTIGGWSTFTELLKTNIDQRTRIS